jgi:choline-sulfatase
MSSSTRELRRLLGRARRRDRPPNILLLMTDQQRWDALGCTGGWVETPHMDGLAEQGVLFANAYTNSPACVPARVSLAIGRYPHNHGVWRNKPYTLPAKRRTWMRAIREAGYGTSVFGKTHLHAQKGDLRDREDLVRAYGLDYVDEIAGPRASARSDSNLTERWREAGVLDEYKRDLEDRLSDRPWVVRPSPVPLDLYPDVYVGQQAAAHLRTLSAKHPWFCWVSFGGPHEPWDAPEPYASRYDPAAMPPPIAPEGDAHERPRGLLDKRREKNRFDFDAGDVARLRANYAGKVTLIDDQIGELLRVVEERGELGRTVVAFVSDHGEMNGDYGLLYKHNFLNPAVRVPFILRLPDATRRAGGAVTETMVELMDLGSTLVELAGGRQLGRSLARSVVPVLEDPSRAHRDVALSEMRREHMIATPDWKLAVNREGESYLLFDLRSDPAETRNLAGLPEHAATERRLKQLLDETVAAAR